MSLFDSASLVVTPNGVKEGKLYSIKPTDGSGDLSVTRATTATRVNSAGLVEVVPYNLLTNSESTWTAVGVTVTSGIIDPIGNLNAYTISNIGSGNATEYAYKSPSAFFVASGTTITYSIYMKGSGTISTYIERAFSGSYFFDTKVHTLSSEYQLFTHSYTATSDFGGVTIYVGNTTGTTANLVTIAFPQVNYGSVAKDYYPTTTRLNIPRLDYTNGSCPSILVEPQRTNVLTYSQDFTNSAWAKSDVTITANSIISPSGILNGSKIIPNSNNTFHAFYESVPTGVYSFSIYAKAGGETTFSMWVNDFSKRAIFDLSSGTITSSNVTNSTITDAGNGWYRCTVYDTTSTSFVAVYGRNGGNFVGNGVDGIYFWGGQVEAGAYPTSYIPTTSASVTRNADVISKTSISSLIGQTEGTMFFDIVFPQKTTPSYIGISDGTTGNRIILGCESDTFFTFGYGYSTLPLNTNTRYKIAMAYNSTNMKIYANGNLLASVAGSVPSGTLSRFAFDSGGGTQNLIASVKTCALFKTKLSDSQLAQLTTL